MEIDKKIILAALVVVLGGNATGIVNAVNPNFRANAFTSLDAAKMKAEIYAKMEHKCAENESAHDDLNIRLTVAEFKINDCMRVVRP